jgi:hypothetical protein
LLAASTHLARSPRAADSQVMAGVTGARIAATATHSTAPAFG